MVKVFTKREISNFVFTEAISRFNWRNRGFRCWGKCSGGNWGSRSGVMLSRGMSFGGFAKSPHCKECHEQWWRHSVIFLQGLIPCEIKSLAALQLLPSISLQEAEEKMTRLRMASQAIIISWGNQESLFLAVLKCANVTYTWRHNWSHP